MPPASAARRLGRSASLYLGSSLLQRGVSFLLTPIYTRYMGPADFGVVAVANAITAVLVVFLGLALHSCIPRLFFEYDEARRRTFYGTLLVVTVLAPLAFAGLVYPIGIRGWLDHVLPNVTFKPHLELVLWTSIFGVFAPLPIAIYVTADEPGRVVALNLGTAFVQTALTIFFVAGLQEGAVGVLRANLCSSAVVGAISLALLGSMAKFDRTLPGLRSAVVYSLPLIPHLVGNWALSISDRLILDKYLPAEEVGRYSLGYMFGLLASVIAASIGQALTPAANRQLKEPALAVSVPRLGTYALLVMVTSALAIALTARETIFIIAPKAYAGALDVVPWAVAGAVFQGVYLIWSIGTWFSMKTKLVPFVTLVSAGLNVVANIAFVPRYGMLAAAIATTASYAVAAALHGALAQKLYPIPWEYRRWLMMMGGATLWYAIGATIPATSPLAISVLSKLFIVGLAFPGTLLVVGFFRKEELEKGRRLVARMRSA